ncbi:acyl-CoA N-acyltransferase [Globomyces pollinis-pini]|nr:acyl-CoA N-acyltransferase [Globomyces pollinis-pini]
MDEIQFGEITDFDEAYQLETKCFSADEAASLEGMKYRFQSAPELFLGAFFQNKLIGLIMATATQSPSITKESMNFHDSKGTVICIHSVCVHPNHRKQGIALLMLEKYIEHIKSLKKSRISLIVHEYLVKFYEKVGFKANGISPIVHGSDPWFEMNLDI